MVNKELLRLEEKENMEHGFDAYVRLIIRRRVKNQIRNYIRYCRRYDVVSMDDVEKLSDGYEEMMPETFKLYAGNYLIVLNDEEIGKALYGIKKNKRDILLLNVIAGQSLAEVADTLDMNYETVRSYKKRAIKEMRGKLGEKRKQ